MEEEKNYQQNIIHHDNGDTTVWNKNSAGCTTKEGYTHYDAETEITVDFWGNQINPKK